MRENVHELGNALVDEYAAIYGADQTVTDEAEYRRHVLAREQAALCLSGGGIRSAAFCLGILQVLARKGVLKQFHYLSTVSGGGFIGAWLSALIREKGSVALAEQELRENEAAPAVRALREYTDYLTPLGGLLSADTWTGIVLYLRNLLITWIVFSPVFLLAVLSTIFYRTLLWRMGGNYWICVGALAFGAGCVTFGTLFGCKELPSHRALHGNNRFAAKSTIHRSIVLPLLIWSFLVPGTLSGWLTHVGNDFAALEFVLPAVYAAAILTGYWCAAIGGRAARLYTTNFGSWLAATACSAFLIWLGMRAANSLHGAKGVASPNQAEFLAVLGPLWLIITNVLQITVFVALRRQALLGDLDREWLARLSALKLRVGVVWTLFAFCCLSLQRLAFHMPGDGWSAPLAMFAAGPVAAWIGQNAVVEIQAAATTPGSLAKALSWGLPLLAAIFAAGLFTTLGYVLGEALGFVQVRLARDMFAIPLDDPVIALPVQVAFGAALVAAMLVLTRRINVNRFSLHGVYRNRLTRAFLGAVRPDRAPDPFTRFDPEDNLRMVALRPREGAWTLFHIVNVALNLSATTRSAWAERKAASFTISPLACGAADLWIPTLKSDDPTGCFVPSGRYAGSEVETGRSNEPKGISLATAMAISGAAVSPNAGYHSSPITAFLMTLFNARLGAWLPNPSVVTNQRELAQAWPRQSLLPMLDDLLGRTTDTTRAVYLSDGGHFDNLGLYEMLRRRCRLILVVDAGADPGCALEDLGAAMRKAYIDQQIDVKFKHRLRVAARDGLAANTMAFAVGTIDYGATVPSGTLLYIKPSYLEDIPAEVRAYGACHPLFPHEPTSDQWFTESQFESYRALGEHQMTGLCEAITGDPTLACLFAAAGRTQDGTPHPVDCA